MSVPGTNWPQISKPKVLHFAHITETCSLTDKQLTVPVHGCAYFNRPEISYVNCNSPIGLRFIC